LVRRFVYDENIIIGLTIIICNEGNIVKKYSNYSADKLEKVNKLAACSSANADTFFACVL